MVFPQTILPIRVELNLGTWTDVTTYVRREPNLITISHGRANETTRITACTASLTLQNWDGRFSERNPVGPYYGLLGRNTPIRISEGRTTNAAELLGSTSDTITCPDAAGLDITGDIDLRLDITPATWRPSAFVDLAGRYNISGNNRAWAIGLNPAGTLTLYWSPDGTLASRLSVTSTASVPSLTERLALRVTLDVNNGAGGSTATFYTSPTIGGTWTQLGAQVVTTGVTSIANVATGIELGDVAALSGVPMAGDVYGFQMLDGIGGVAKASPDFTAAANGSISTVDAQGNTWFLNGPNSFVTDHWTYFVGEVTEWPQDWDISRQDPTVLVEASGILRRLGQGTSVLRSTLYRALSGSASSPVAYWPCEDGEGSTQIASTSPLVPAMTFAVAPTFAAYDGFVCSTSLPTTQNSAWYGAVPAYAASNTQQVRFMFHIDAGVNGERIFTVYLSGSVRSIRLHYGTSGSLNLLAYDATEAVLASTGAIAFNIDGKKLRLSIEITQNGANVDFGVVSLEVGATLGSVASATAAGQTAGRVTGVGTNAGGGLVIGTNLVTYGHISVHNTITSIYDLASEIKAFDGETAGTRFARLCGEQGVPFQSIGDLTLTEPMGPQQPGTFLNLLYECVDLDNGLMYEPRNALGLGYRTRISLENQPVKLPIDHAAHELAAPLKPVPDDSTTRNKATITRKGGSSATAELTSGRMSTQDPPNGVGEYDTALTVNTNSDDRLPHLANYAVYMGTVDEERYPGITVDMATRELVANPVLTARFRRMDVGDRLAISNPPTPQLPPDTIGQLVQGYKLTIAQFEKKYALNCSPATPWDFAILEDATFSRLDTAGSELVSAATSGATSLDVTTTVGPLWVTDPAEFPVVLELGGERVSATAATAGISDTFTRTTANGWGSADTGQAWTRDGGVAGDYSVNGSAGVISLGAVNSSRFMVSSQFTKGYEIQMRARTLVLALTQPINVALVGCWANNNSFYLARMAFYPDTSVRLSIEKAPFALLAAEVAQPGLVHAANTWYRLKFRIQEGLLQAKAWLDGGTEPGAWTVSAFDSSYTSGLIAVRSILTAGNTNILPTITQYDDLASTNPQRLTVTRAVNGVTKAQTIGTDIRLADPTILSL